MPFRRNTKTDGKPSVDACAFFLNTPIQLPRPPKEGDLIGLELELEGRNVAMERRAVKGWTQTEDGSLRGESVEYLFSKPVVYDEAVKNVTRLFEAFNKQGVELRNSYRTSTHVHFNFSDKTPKQVLNFVVVHTILEQVLENYCGENRKGNLFCLSLRDADAIVELLEAAYLYQHNFVDFRNDNRYCALNLCSLNKFGSIEIRTMGGAKSAEEVQAWLKILKQMYDFACYKMETPRKLIEALSMYGAQGWMDQIFDKEISKLLVDSWDEKEGTLHNSMFEGARLIQHLSYRLEEAYNVKFEPKVNIKKAKAAKPKMLSPDVQRAISEVTLNQRHWIIIPDDPDRAASYEGNHGTGWSVSDVTHGSRVQGVGNQVITYDATTGIWIETIDRNGEPVFERWHFRDWERLMEEVRIFLEEEEMARAEVDEIEMDRFGEEEEW